MLRAAIPWCGTGPTATTSRCARFRWPSYPASADTTTPVCGAAPTTPTRPGFPYDKLVDYAKGPTTAAQPDLVQQIVDQLRNPAGIGWPQFVGNTIGDALAALQTTLTTRLKTLVR